MSSPDPDFWQEVSKWLAAAMAVPVLYVWKRVNGSVQKDEFREFIERFDRHVEHDREIQAKLFDKVDEVKTLLIERLK